MRALVADSSAPSRIVFRDVPEPVLATGDVTVAVRAFSINRGELGLLRRKPDGWRPGWDFAGNLEADIEGGLRAGSRVVGIRQGGTWAERVGVAPGSIAELPDAVSFAQGAALPTAGLAALRMLRLGPAILGRRVLITGASGGVGRFAIQLAHLVVRRSRRWSTRVRPGPLDFVSLVRMTLWQTSGSSVAGST